MYNKNFKLFSSFHYKYCQLFLSIVHLLTDLYWLKVWFGGVLNIHFVWTFLLESFIYMLFELLTNFTVYALHIAQKCCVEIRQNQPNSDFYFLQTITKSRYISSTAANAELDTAQIYLMRFDTYGHLRNVFKTNEIHCLHLCYKQIKY